VSTPRDRQLVALADRVVIGVVRGRDLVVTPVPILYRREVAITGMNCGRTVSLLAIRWYSVRLP
jgi:hypothetical protein